jgi:hypothetical protein
MPPLSYLGREAAAEQFQTSIETALIAVFQYASYEKVAPVAFVNFFVLPEPASPSFWAARIVTPIVSERVVWYELPQEPRS